MSRGARGCASYSVGPPGRQGRDGFQGLRGDTGNTGPPGRDGLVTYEKLVTEPKFEVHPGEWYCSTEATITVRSASVVRVLIHNAFPGPQSAWFPWQVQLFDAHGGLVSESSVRGDRAIATIPNATDHDAHAFFEVAPGAYRIFVNMGQKVESVVYSMAESAFVEFQAVTTSRSAAPG